MPSEGDENYLTTAEVARRLQVKPATVYAYVSRGLLTSVRARGRRGSLFPAADVERLAARSVEHSGVVERIESELTLLQDDNLYYRGHSAQSLATTATLPQVATLLWTGQPPTDPAMEGDLFGVEREGVALARAAMEVVPAGARLTDRLRVAVAVLGAADPLRFDLSATSVTAAAGRLIGTLVAALPGPIVTRTTLGGKLWPKLTDAEPHPEILDAALILLADHGLAVSTVAARVAASARANLYAVISAGLGALDGQYHGAAPTLAYEFLDRAKHDPLKALSDQLRSGEPIPGFGHRIYQHRDPRADVLLELLSDHPIVSTIHAIADRTPAFPNSDLALAAVMHAYNFRPDAGDALFALARMIGWTAHALEEYAAPALRFRTLGIYTGQTT
ncbi:citrate/2-methylcitrate synthase [Kribbella speibonae]|uniref:citrate synthase (unknown stereospecificity) n=1 Tax=Kribbella speibonae TaxID=1572660 RepID=A0A4R0IKY0_9ACTN|nr:citrate/2-methylcitrate synthase [Kribbella speibonae]TCC21896.1 helix-turn-helix domain-containing protein [Kribbella speibonae]TCC34183.1 helix-turn-helix domain-containing protein [Kribbella speibonae]